MIYEFQDLSDKINQLANLVASLRAENGLLRQANTLLEGENLDFKIRLSEGQRRLVKVLESLPPPPGGPEADLDAIAPFDGGVSPGVNGAPA